MQQTKLKISIGQRQQRIFMEIYQLRGFAAVAELGHLTRAAEKLHISQPALSAQIKSLEEELEVELFERTPNGMLLTAPGKRILAAAENVLAAAQALHNEARVSRGAVESSVTVGTVSDPEFIQLGALSSAAVERYPLLQIQFHREVSGEAFEHVREGRRDASFYYGELTHPSVEGVALREIAYRVAAPAAWAERVEGAGWEDIAGEPWILTPPISTHCQLAQLLFHKHGGFPTKVVEADDETVISSLVVSGVGLALVREDLAMEKVRRGEICLWKDVRLATTLQFIYLKERKQDPEIQALLELLNGIWKVRRNEGHAPPSETRIASRTTA